METSRIEVKPTAQRCTVHHVHGEPRPRNIKDIESAPWEPVVWHDAAVMESLLAIRRRAELQALDAVRWYNSKKDSKRWWSRWLRGWAITFTVLGGLVPFIAATGLLHAKPGSQESNEVIALHFNQFGYVFLGLAAGCVAFDRFFGFSSNWMRYIAAALRIETATTKFRFDWEQVIAPLRGVAPLEPEVVNTLLKLIARYSLAVREAIEHETGAWMMEFQTNLSQFDKETKALFDGARQERQALDAKHKLEARAKARQAKGASGNRKGT
jgi:hypothetical protein